MHLCIALGGQVSGSETGSQCLDERGMPLRLLPGLDSYDSWNVNMPFAVAAESPAHCRGGGPPGDSEILSA
jgi:hypothetical protein